MAIEHSGRSRSSGGGAARTASAALRLAPPFSPAPNHPQTAPSTHKPLSGNPQTPPRRRRWASPAAAAGSPAAAARAPPAARVRDAGGSGCESRPPGVRLAQLHAPQRPPHAAAGSRLLPTHLLVGQVCDKLDGRGAHGLVVALVRALELQGSRAVAGRRGGGRAAWGAGGRQRLAPRALHLLQLPPSLPHPHCRCPPPSQLGAAHTCVTTRCSSSSPISGNLVFTTASSAA